MNVALFGGTFDPIHRGHLALARAAQKQFRLDQIHFVTAHVSPHKQQRAPASFTHRYTMVVLATLDEKKFVPSLLEERSGPSYTIDTVRKFKRLLKKGDRLFFLIGIDAFLDIAKWRDAEALLKECEFVVASRPSYSLEDVASALPPTMQPPKPASRRSASRTLQCGGAVIHLLKGVYHPISSTEIRSAAARGASVTRWVPSRVAHYIKKLHLYKPESRPIMEGPAQQ